jgi:hypothetical protein
MALKGIAQADTCCITGLPAWVLGGVWGGIWNPRRAAVEWPMSRTPAADRATSARKSNIKNEIEACVAAGVMNWELQREGGTVEQIRSQDDRKWNVWLQKHRLLRRGVMWCRGADSVEAVTQAGRGKWIRGRLGLTPGVDPFAAFLSLSPSFLFRLSPPLSVSCGDVSPRCSLLRCCYQRIRHSLTHTHTHTHKNMCVHTKIDTHSHTPLYSHSLHT